MNRFFVLIYIIVCNLLFASCTSGYDMSVCERLSDKIVREEPLSQDDYEDMLFQYESILKYLIDRADEVIDEDDSDKRAELQQKMRNDDEYLKRFSYMFTFGSTLYQADVNKSLDAKNLNTYRSLERYADEFAHRSEEL